MIKWILILLFSVVMVFGLIFLFWKKVGDIRPALIPANKSSSSPITLPSNSTNSAKIVGELVPFDLQLPGNLEITRVAKGLGKVRDLQTIPGGIMVASVTANPGKILVIMNNNKLLNPPKVLIDGLDNPHGIAFFNGKLYIASENDVRRYNFDSQNLTATLDRQLFNLPAGGSGHITRSIVFDNDGKMYVSVGSTCNVCREQNFQNDTVLTADQDGNNLRVYSKGLRNAVFLALDKDTNQIYVTENSRDLLGDNIPPDEIDILKDGGNFGWPYCYGNKIQDSTFDGQYSKCSDSITPAFEIQAHSAPLGLTFIDSKQFPEDTQGDLLVAYHGSWNRSVPTGYKIVRLKRNGSKITGQEDFITGFLNGSTASGRPVDLEFSSDGTLFISDDKAGSIYAVNKK